MSTKKISTKTKGIIAVAAGGALLLGSGATFAFWEDDATITGREIMTGHLKVSATMDWKFTGPGADGGGATPTTLDGNFLMIPGHKVTGTGIISPELAGTGLVADLTIAGGGTTYQPAQGELLVTWNIAGTTTVGSTVTVDALTPSTIPAGGVPVTVTIELPPLSNSTMDTTVTADAFAVTLSQRTS